MAWPSGKVDDGTEEAVLYNCSSKMVTNHVEFSPELSVFDLET